MLHSKTKNNIKFNEIYNTYSKSMYRIALAILNDRSLSEDAVQIAFVKIYKIINEIGEINNSKTKSLIVIIIRNVSIDIYRKRAKDKVISFEDIGFNTGKEDVSPIDIIINQETIETITKCLGEINPTYADTFTLHYYHGYSISEIGEMLDISKQNVSFRISMAKKAIKSLLVKKEVSINE